MEAKEVAKRIYNDFEQPLRVAIQMLDRRGGAAAEIAEELQEKLTKLAEEAGR